MSTESRIPSPEQGGQDPAPGSEPDQQASLRTKQAADLLQIQRDLAVALHRAESSMEMLERCFKAAIDASEMDSGGIYLFDLSSGALDLIYHQGLPASFIQLVSHYDPDTENARMVQAGAPIYSNFTELTPPLLTIGLKEGLRAVAVIPILQKRQHRVVGSLHLSSHTCDVVPEHTRYTLETIAYQIGDAIANKLAQEALQQSEARFRALVEATNDWVWEIDSRFLYSYVSPRVQEHLGYEPAELLGRSPFDFMSKAEAAKIGAVFREIAASKQAFHCLENVCLHKDGTQVVVQTSGTPILDEEGTLHGYRGLDRNITEQRADETKRRELEAQVQQAQKLECLGVLAGGIAHDFNNLLVGIIGNAELAQMALAPGHPGETYLRNIETAAGRAAELSNQMLAYSGQGKFIIERINIQTLIEEMATLLERNISSGVTIAYDFLPDVPPIEADPTQLRQIVMNLILNASDAYGDHEGVMRLRTGTMTCDRDYLREIHLCTGTREGTYSYLDVIDEGCGMNQETLSKMFDPFFTTKFTGRGLGLAAVLGIVRGHDGLLKVESTPGQGTHVRVLFPAVFAPASKPAAPAKDHSGVCFDGMTALLVDDDEIVRAVGESMLNVLGLHVVTADNGQQAIELFQQDPDRIDFIILDLTMPHLDGAQTFTALRGIKEEICVILSSGYDKHDLTTRFSGDGFSGFIQKPYKIAQLKAALLDARKALS